MALKASSSRILFDLGLEPSMGSDIGNSSRESGSRDSYIARGRQVNLAPVALNERDPQPKMWLRGSGPPRLPVDRVVAGGSTDSARATAWPKEGLLARKMAVFLPTTVNFVMRNR